MQIRLGFEDINQEILQKAIVVDDDSFGQMIEVNCQLYILWKDKKVIIIARKMSGRFPRLQTLEILGGANPKRGDEGSNPIISIAMSKADGLDNDAYNSNYRPHLDCNGGNHQDEDDLDDETRKYRYECLASNLYLDLTGEGEDSANPQCLDTPWKSLRYLLEGLSSHMANKIIWSSESDTFLPLDVRLDLGTECLCHKLARLLGGVEQHSHYAFEIGTSYVDVCCRKRMDWM